MIRFSKLPLSPLSISPISTLRFTILLLVGLLVLSGCAEAGEQFNQEVTLTVSLTADGRTTELPTTAVNVRAFLEENNVSLHETDEVSPPLFTPLSEGLNVEVVRVTESIDLIERSIPFERKLVRNESMSEDDSPVILQAGQAGLEELTVRIVYRDGLEVERRVTQSTVVEEAQDEIVMIGLGVGVPDNVSFGGTLAYINGGQAVVMRGNTAFPETLDVGGELDRRVFSLSPTGSHLLYTRVPTDTADTDSFNSLWVISTGRNAQPRPLGINNVLWADWNPDRSKAQQIAYSTGLAIDLPPGWEANNDLWVGEVRENDDAAFEPEQIVESYPATYGWWGGNYEWAPDGRSIAYSYADEVGVINLLAARQLLQEQTTNINEEGARSPRQPLARFTEFDTGSDWVWLPSLSWSPDARYLAYTQHGGDNTSTMQFDTHVVDVLNSVNGRFRSQAGIWGYPRWSPFDDDGLSQIAYLQSTDPLDSLRSSYTLWIMDTDGSNARQIYPLVGENSYFSRNEQFLAWSGTGEDIAYIFDDDLYLMNLESGSVYRITQNDALVTHPSWAPYGAAVTSLLQGAQPAAIPVTSDEERGSLLPDQ